MTCVLNVRCFGAKGDADNNGNGTDDYAAFVAAQNAAPDEGCEIVCPLTPGSYYRLSQALNLTKPIHWRGTHYGSIYPQTKQSCGLIFDADASGLIVNGHNTLDYTTVPTLTHPGATYCIIENFHIKSAGGQTGLLNGGTGVDVDGIYIRNICEIRRVTVTDFKRDNFRIVATGGAGGSEEGNANLTRLLSCRSYYAGANGFYLRGGNANVIKLENCIADVNAGRGFFDEGFLGNIYDGCHGAGNGLGDFETNGVNAYHIFSGCYSEVGNPVKPKIMSPAIVVGGILSGPYVLSDDSTALAISAVGTIRKAIRHTNLKNAVSLFTDLGSSSDDLVAFHWGKGEAGAENAWYAITWDVANKAWKFQSANNPSFIPMWFPQDFSIRAFAPFLQNGYYIGAPYGPNVHFDVGTGPPVSEKCKQGDYRRNINQAKGQPKGWSCTVSGAPGIPGIWESEGNL